jgi:hypothetical protein
MTTTTTIIFTITCFLSLGIGLVITNMSVWNCIKRIEELETKIKQTM